MADAGAVRGDLPRHPSRSALPAATRRNRPGHGDRHPGGRDRRGSAPWSAPPRWSGLPPGANRRLAAPARYVVDAGGGRQGARRGPCTLRGARRATACRLLIGPRGARVSLINFTARCRPRGRELIRGWSGSRMAGAAVQGREAALDLMHAVRDRGGLRGRPSLAVFMHRPILRSEILERSSPAARLLAGTGGPVVARAVQPVPRPAWSPGAPEARDLWSAQPDARFSLSLLIPQAPARVVFYRSTAARGRQAGRRRPRRRAARNLYTSLAFCRRSSSAARSATPRLRVAGECRSTRRSRPSPGGRLSRRGAASRRRGRERRSGTPLDERAMARVAPVAGAVVGRRA